MMLEGRVRKRKHSLGEVAAGRPLKMTSTTMLQDATTLKAPTRTSTRSKAIPPKSKTATGPSACPLIQTLRQYGLLETIISCLTPSDLLSLALCCKATYNAMMPRAGSLENLLSKMPCSGSGIALRQRMHSKSTFFYAYECTEFAQCRTASGRLCIDARPCSSCKVTTCDECRIHCVYQSIYEAPSHPEDLPNFSGFVLLEPYEVGILSPHHLALEPDLSETDNSPKWQNRATDTTAGPYHDQGFLDLPLQLDQVGTPEKISDVIDVDLGSTSLKQWSGTSQFGFPAPVLRSLCNVAEQRKLFLCDFCFTDAGKGYKALVPDLPKLSWLDESTGRSAKRAPRWCHCSLRSRVLDRWQCVRCYAKEQSIIEDVHSMAPEPEYQECRCGMPANRTVCLWCWGEVAERSDVGEGTEAVERLDAVGLVESDDEASIYGDAGWTSQRE